jgi:shikimate kinase
MAEAAKRNIILCGFMATGKSTIGKRLAEEMHYRFLDMDALIEEEQGVSIPQIFASQGEPAFRALESQMVERIAEWSGHVIATGGGTIVNPRNLERLKSCGVLISLTADIQTILRRTGREDSRPMLQGGDKLERIRQLLELRMPFYAQADIVLDTSTLSIRQVVQSLRTQLRDYGFAA